MMEAAVVAEDAAGRFLDILFVIAFSFAQCMRRRSIAE